MDNNVYIRSKLGDEFAQKILFRCFNTFAKEYKNENNKY